MPRLIVPALLLSVALSASGAELGDVSVRSHIGQQLSADIELVDLSSADLADLQVRLASPDVFAGARVTMNPALGSLNMSVFRDGSRRVLHLTTLQPVNAELVHIFFELSSGGRQIVRTASLWLTRETVPARTAVATAPAASAAPAVAAAVPARTAIAPAGAASMSPAAAAAVPAAGTPAPAVAQSSAARAPVGPASRPLAAASGEPTDGAIAMPPSARAGAPARAPTADVSTVAIAVSAGAATAAAASPAAQRHPVSRPSPDEELMKAAAERSFAARRSAPGNPAAASVARPAPPAAVQPARLAIVPARPAEACSPALIEARAQQCAAMDASNKELTTKLVDLEGKVKRLQSALTLPPIAAQAQAPSAAAPGQAPSTSPTLSAPKPSAVPKTAPAHEPVAPEKAATTQTASGAITDARAGAPAKPAKPAEPAKKPEEAKHTKDAKPAAEPTAPEEKPKKMSRPRLISLIAGGALGLLVLIGVAVHLVRKRRAKGGPLKIWQSFRKKDKPQDPLEPTMTEATESVSEPTS
ncbi:MAG TPA: hypothetical protein VGF27_16695 [Pseudoduganella sp.]